MTGVFALVLAGCSAQSARSHPSVTSPTQHRESYGSLPSFLPSNTVANDAAIEGRSGHPAITSEGDDVRAHTGSATVLAQVSGPVVPGEGLPVQAEATTCTWRVTMRAATKPIPLAAAQFNALDHLGTVYPVRAIAGRQPMPRSVAPGHSATFELRAVMPTGEGLMRWAPDRKNIVAEWDFTVEND